MSEHIDNLVKTFGEVEAKERKACEGCEGIEKCGNSFRGHHHIVTYPYGKDEVPCLQPVACEHEKARAAIAKMKALLHGSGMGRRFMNRTFEAFDRKLNPKAFDASKKYASDFTSKTADGLIFMGYVGVGKTHLAAAILHEVIKRGAQPVFIAAPDLAFKLSTSWQEGDTRSLSEKVQNAQLLFIDDLGKEKDTETITTFIFQTINSRYEDCKPTIITTNLTRDELKERYGEAIYSRLTEMCRTIIMTGSDYRTESAARV